METADPGFEHPSVWGQHPSSQGDRWAASDHFRAVRNPGSPSAVLLSDDSESWCLQLSSSSEQKSLRQGRAPGWQGCTLGIGVLASSPPPLLRRPGLSPVCVPRGRAVSKARVCVLKPGLGEVSPGCQTPGVPAQARQPVVSPGGPAERWQAGQELVSVTGRERTCCVPARGTQLRVDRAGQVWKPRGKWTWMKLPKQNLPVKLLSC